MKKLSMLLPAMAIMGSLLLSSCGNDTTRVSATGSIYECLVVMDVHPLAEPEHIISPSAYDEDINTNYDLIRATLNERMPAMPQVEPYFTVSQVNTNAFDDFLKPTRNILIIDINPHRYTQVKAKYSRDYWSHPQAVCRVQAPDEAAFVAYWRQYGEQIRSWFINEEIARQMRFYRGSTNKEARAALAKQTGCDMLIPEDYMLLMDSVYGDTTLLWCCNNKGSLRRDIVIYSYPYTDEQTFTADYLNARRDAVLGRFVSATVEGSYMGTEYKVEPPICRLMQDRDVPESARDTIGGNGFYGAEVRGLWKMYAGEAMGGPYVSLTRLDPYRGRIITAEAFVFAPGQKKRSALRQAEAVLYTLQMQAN